MGTIDSFRNQGIRQPFHTWGIGASGCSTPTRFHLRYTTTGATASVGRAILGENLRIVEDSNLTSLTINQQKIWALTCSVMLHQLRRKNSELLITLSSAAISFHNMGVGNTWKWLLIDPLHNRACWWLLSDRISFERRAPYK